MAFFGVVDLWDLDGQEDAGIPRIGDVRGSRWVIYRAKLAIRWFLSIPKSGEREEEEKLKAES
jgi:hypothetical protein